MRLVQDRNPGAFAVKVRCVKCGTVKQLAEMWSDLDGKAFHDYYCAECRPMSYLVKRANVRCNHCGQVSERQDSDECRACGNETHSHGVKCVPIEQGKCLHGFRAHHA